MMTAGEIDDFNKGLDLTESEKEGREALRDSQIESSKKEDSDVDEDEQKDEVKEIDTAIREVEQIKMKKEHKVPKNIPLRPFQAPPTIIDVTSDCLFEKNWIPLKTLTNKNAEPEEVQANKFDRGNVDRNLFDAFYDNGDVMKEFEENPKELNDYPAYWRTEAILSDKAKVVINGFEVLNPEPFDIFKIKPMSYNLSIQYDREKRKEDDKVAKQK